MQVNFQVQKFGTNFSGLYERKSTITKTSGRANINKRTIVLSEFIYHPFEKETATEITEAIDKYMIGRSFVLWEKDHGHQEGLYYTLNRVKVGDIVEEKNTDRFLNAGYSKKPISGVQNYDDFMETYNNEAYGTMDVYNLNRARVETFIEENF